MDQLSVLFPWMPDASPDALVFVEGDVPLAVIVIHIAVDIQNGPFIVRCPAAGIPPKRLSAAFKCTIGFEFDPSVIGWVVLFRDVFFVFVDLFHGPCADYFLIEVVELPTGRQKYQ